MYKPSIKEAWKGRIDAHDGELGLRWHQAINLLNLSEELETIADGEIAFAFLGFCCDEGVRRNQGRVGAVGGPAALRAAMASFAHHLPQHVKLFDAGDVICTNQNLEEAQEQLGRKVALLLQHGFRPLVLGGGHEVAFGHFLGLEKATADRKLGILNFDAHFDLRSYEQQSSSGTPFLQISDTLQGQNRPFLYKVMGLQEYGNTRKLFQTADKLDVNYTAADDVRLFYPCSPRPGPLPPHRQHRRGRRAHPGGHGARVRAVGPGPADGLPAGILVPHRPEPASEPPTLGGQQGAADPPSDGLPGPCRGGAKPGQPFQGARLAADRST